MASSEDVEMPDVDWQLKCSKISQRGKYLLENSKCTDCELVVGIGDSQEVIRSHRVILAMSSPVFESMLFGNKDDDQIVLPDVDAQTFKYILQFIYTDTLIIKTLDDACSIHFIAQNYKFPLFVIENCNLYFWSKLIPETACRIYEIAIFFNHTSLSEAALKMMCTDTMAVLNDTNFEEIQFSTLMMILNQDELKIDSELSLFRAIERFAETLERRIPNKGSEKKWTQSDELNINLRDAIHLVRFLNLSPQQFATIACSSLITHEESFAVFMNISSTEANIFPMPNGFSIVKKSRREEYLNVNKYFAGLFANPTVNQEKLERRTIRARRGCRSSVVPSLQDPQ